LLAIFAMRTASIVKQAGLIHAACPGLQKTRQPGLHLAYAMLQQRQVPGVPSGVIVVSDGNTPVASMLGGVRQ
jgi:hypothetical protein